MNLRIELDPTPNTQIATQGHRDRNLTFRKNGRI